MKTVFDPSLRPPSASAFRHSHSRSRLMNMENRENIIQGGNVIPNILNDSFVSNNSNTKSIPIPSHAGPLIDIAPKITLPNMAINDPASIIKKQAHATGHYPREIKLKQQKDNDMIILNGEVPPMVPSSPGSKALALASEASQGSNNSNGGISLSDSPNSKNEFIDAYAFSKNVDKKKSAGKSPLSEKLELKLPSKESEFESSKPHLDHSRSYMDLNVGGMSTNQKLSAKKQMKIRKKRKFRLIPTFKNFEYGRFVGREAELRDMRHLLCTSAAVNGLQQAKEPHLNPLDNYNKLSILCLTGQHGVGKSSLAYVYTMTFERKYKYIFWLNGSSLLSDARDILLYHLENPYEVQCLKSETAAEVIRVRFLHFLTELQNDWLLVVDEYNDPRVEVQDWIPRKMEKLTVNKLHQVMSGHVILTTSMVPTTMNRLFCNFQTTIKHFRVPVLNEVEAASLLVKFSTNVDRTPDSISEEEINAVQQIVSEECLGCEALPLALMANLSKQQRYSLRTMLAKFMEQMNILNLKRVEELRCVYDKIQDKLDVREQHRKRKHKQYLATLSLPERLAYSGKYMFDLINGKKRKPRQKIFEADLFELELLLKRFELTKYMESFVETGIHSPRQVAHESFRNNMHWKKLYVVDGKANLGTVRFDTRDFEKLEELILFVKNRYSQDRVNVLMKLWLESLSVGTQGIENPDTPELNSTYNSRSLALGVLRQCSWLSPNRIPLFIFPEMLTEHNLFEHSEMTSDNTSMTLGHASFSTVTHNTAALSSLNLSPHLRFAPKPDNKINGSRRFMNPELDILGDHQGIFTFLVWNNLIKMEKTGFFSCPSIIQNAVHYAEKQNNDIEGTFQVIHLLLHKLHLVSFEANFEDLIGENLMLLRLNPSLMRNDYNQIDVKYNISLLQDAELQVFFSHDFNLKLSILAHLSYVREACFSELNSNPAYIPLLDGYSKRTELVKKEGDTYGIKSKNDRSYQRFLSAIYASREDPQSANQNQNIDFGFNATRAALIPPFLERSLSLVKGDLVFNEGLLILNVPFRKTRLADALNCFRSAYNVYTKAISKISERNGVPTLGDVILAKAAYYLGITLFKQRSYTEALEGFELSLKHYYEYYGEFTNHVDIARNLSSIACVYHELAKTGELHVDQIQLPGDMTTLADEETDLFPQEARKNSPGSKKSAFELASESMKYHSLALQMYQDLMGHDPINVNYAKSLLNKAKTAILLKELYQAEADMKRVLDIYNIVAKTCPIYLKHKANAAINLGNIYLLMDADAQPDHKCERFLLCLNAAMDAQAELSRFEMRVLNLKRPPKDSLKPHDGLNIDQDHVGMDIMSLPPHAAVSETLVLAAEILLRKDFIEEAVVLLQASLLKYREIFGTFHHPKIASVESILSQIETNL